MEPTRLQNWCKKSRIFTENSRETAFLFQMLTVALQSDREILNGKSAQLGYTVVNVGSRWKIQDRRRIKKQTIQRFN